MKCDIKNSSEIAGIEKRSLMLNIRARKGERQ